MQPQGHVQVLSNLSTAAWTRRRSGRRLGFASPHPPATCRIASPALLQADRGSIVVHFEEGFPRDAVDFVEMAGYRVVRNVTGHARRMFGRGQCVVETAGQNFAAASSGPAATAAATAAPLTDGLCRRARPHTRVRAARPPLVLL